MFRKRHSLKIRISSIVICFLMLLSLMPFLSESFYVDAASRYRMTTYNKVIKIGSTVYCAGAKGIYMVTLKNGKIRSKSLLVQAKKPFGAYTYIGEMRKAGNYIYYLHGSEGTLWTIRRVNVKTKTTKYYTSVGEQRYFGYVINNGRLYFDKPYYDRNYNYRSSVQSMSLNGGAIKKAPSVIPVMTAKDSNARGYTVYIKQKGRYAKDYLKTPKGTFYLGTAKIR